VQHADCKLAVDGMRMYTYERLIKSVTYHKVCDIVYFTVNIKVCRTISTYKSYDGFDRAYTKAQESQFDKKTHYIVDLNEQLLV
jgi:hypothetical protein